MLSRAKTGGQTKIKKKQMKPLPTLNARPAVARSGTPRSAAIVSCPVAGGRSFSKAGKKRLAGDTARARMSA